MKIRTKLIVGFLVIVALIWVTVFAASNTYTGMHEEFELLKEDIVPGAIEIIEMEAKAQEIKAWTFLYVYRGNVVRMDLTEPIPEDAHSEDWQIGNRKARLVHELSDAEHLNFCKNHEEPSLLPLNQTGVTRSLILVRPERFTSFTFQIDTSWEGKRSYVPRCGFVVGGQQYLRKPISDAEWRRYGRKYLRDNQRPRLKDILDENQTEGIWLTVGRNMMGSTVFLMVVGIHMFPVKRFEMDFKRI